MVAILVVLTVVVFVAIDVVVARRHRALGKEAVPAAVAMAQPHPPQGIFLHDAHSWLRINPDGALRVGVDEFLAEAVGEVQAVTVPARGTQVKRGEPLLRLAVKGRELVVPSPVTGEVMATNEQVTSKPWLMTRDPYGVGWILSIWTRDHQEAIKGLRIGPAVVGFLRQEMARLADFLSAPSVALAPARLVADGGVPCRGSVAALDESGWQAFEREFLSAPKES